MVSYSALKAVCSAGDDVERQRTALKKLFGSFVKCDKNVVRTQVTFQLQVAMLAMKVLGFRGSEDGMLDSKSG